MLAAEWNLEDAIKVAREESWESGVEHGIEKGWEKGRELFSSIMSQAKSMDELKQLFETTYTHQS
jgi:flagellar biosynthesis/type III secretory pathway protein FliH